MKTAIYIEDGTVQLVLTPESEFEKNAIRHFEEKSVDAKIFAGSFYDCRGGWVRQKHHRPNGDYVSRDLDQDDRSLIIKVSQVQPDQIQQP